MASISGGALDVASPLEELSEQECWLLLSGQGVGRVGLTAGAMPAILPVNYAVFDGAIVFRTTVGSKLSAAIAHAVVCFEVDFFDSDTRQGWSVLAVGMADELTEPLRSRVIGLPLEPWAGEGRDHVVSIVPRVLSGRRIGPVSPLPS
ncbi:MAG TPA: pyridoxamine 5'-phosphate oxidase family protein [Acidimicrobiales bacterium]|nr:pyridoxamine 5'-phosphate oxidase family protein [Acidimicrobiales bacterium]